MHFLLQPLIAAIAFRNARSGASLAYLVTQNFLIHTTPPDNFTVTLTSEVVVFFCCPIFFEKNANGGWLLDVLVVPLDRGNTFQVEVSPLVPEPLSFSCNIVTHFPSRKSEIPKKNN